MVADLKAKVAPLKEQTARLKAVEKELDRTKLALEELQETHDTLVENHAALQRRASRPVTVNLTALVPVSLLAKGDAAIAPLLAPVMPTLQRAWTGTMHVGAQAWDGATTAWARYAPVVVDASRKAVEVGGNHATAGIAAARAYVQDSGLVRVRYVTNCVRFENLLICFVDTCCTGGARPCTVSRAQVAACGPAALLPSPGVSYQGADPQLHAVRPACPARGAREPSAAQLLLLGAMMLVIELLFRRCMYSCVLWTCHM